MWNIYLLVCTAAMFGFLPKHADDSLYNMIVYNLFPVETKFDAKGPLVSNYCSTDPLDYTTVSSIYTSYRAFNQT
jgi:hypothetical protein